MDRATRTVSQERFHHIDDDFPLHLLLYVDRQNGDCEKALAGASRTIRRLTKNVNIPLLESLAEYAGECGEEVCSLFHTGKI